MLMFLSLVAGPLVLCRICISFCQVHFVCGAKLCMSDWENLRLRIVIALKMA